jgi:heme/copper-type cytochrome/quinol oxidase subunit 3
MTTTTAHAHEHEAHHTSTGLNSRKMLFWAFLGSECMFFGSLIATYVTYRGRDHVGPHPHDILNIPFTSVSAFVLLMSSLTMVLALAAVQHGNVRGTRIWLAATALLGMTFIGGQCYEFTEFFQHGLSLQKNMFGSTFFVLTGFHGTHVTVGVIWLWTLFAMALRGRLPQNRALDVEICGLYWHFVDVVWVAIFTLVYLIQ